MKEITKFNLSFDFYRTVKEDEHVSHDTNICTECVEKSEVIPEENLSDGIGTCGVAECNNEARYYLQLD